MNTLSAVIFDLDGTLIDSAPDLRAAVNVALAGLGRTPLDLSIIVSFVGNGVEALVERSLIATGGSDPDLHAQALGLFLQAYEVDRATLTQVYPGVMPCLDHLRAQGIRLGLCTNKPQDLAEEICAALGLGPYFDALHGARAGVPKKPDPASLLACIADMQGDAQRTLYVGDSAVDHATARNSGVRFALFTGGYLNDPLDAPAPALRFDAWTQGWLEGL